MRGSPLPQSQVIALDQLSELKTVHVTAEAVTYKGRQALQVTDAAGPEPGLSRLVVLPQVELGAGTIELEVAGNLAPGAEGDLRGFVGLAFRVSGQAYEGVYLRPTNGRAEDQLRRNHAVQYHASPDFPWFKLREEQPGVYETYADMVPGEWIKMRLEFSGLKAQLYVGNAEQPTLIVNDLKHGEGTGGVALWIGPGTLAHFADLRITPAQ